jgi:hypothetical protein
MSLICSLCYKCVTIQKIKKGHIAKTPYFIGGEYRIRTGHLLPASQEQPTKQANSKMLKTIIQPH